MFRLERRLSLVSSTQAGAPPSAPPPIPLEPSDFFQVGQEEPGLQIYLRHDLFRALDEFAVRDTSRELAALLVGQLGETADGDFVLVEDAIEIPIADDQGSRFNTRSWQQARRVARTKHQNKIIVGWYHTHPGTGLELSSEEREVHGAFFPESWQMMYVVDPVSRDRNFLRTVEGRLCPVRGFRVYGREAAQLGVEKESPPAREDPMKERYLERSMEKILRQLRRPAVRPIDVLIMLLLVANLAMPWLKPAPVARVDPTPLRADLQKISAQLKALSSKVATLEQHLAAMAVIDEQLTPGAATPGVATPRPDATAGDSSPTPAASVSPVPSPSVTPTPEANTGPSGNVSLTPPSPKPGDAIKPGEVREVKVKSGDTLSLLAERYYGTSSSKVVSALAHYNKMKSTHVYLGQTLKIPHKAALTR